MADRAQTSMTYMVLVERDIEKNNLMQKELHTNGSLAPQQIVYLECTEITNESEIFTSDVEVKEENMEFTHYFENERLLGLEEDKSKSPAEISDASNFQILTDGQWSRNCELETDGQIDVKVEHTESSHDYDQILLRQVKGNVKTSLAEKSHNCDCKHQSSDSNHDNKMVQELKSEFAIATEKYKQEIERLERKLKSSREVSNRRLIKINTLHKRIERLEQKNVSLYQLLTKRFENEGNEQ